jgi:hypothetical protein
VRVTYPFTPVNPHPGKVSSRTSVITTVDGKQIKLYLEIVGHLVYTLKVSFLTSHIDVICYELAS